MPLRNSIFDQLSRPCLYKSAIKRTLQSAAQHFYCRLCERYSGSFHGCAEEIRRLRSALSWLVPIPFQRITEQRADRDSLQKYVGPFRGKGQRCRPSERP